MTSDAAPARSFRVGSSFSLPGVIQSLGYSPQSVFAQAGVDLALYAHPENRIAAVDLGRLLACAAETTGRADIALLAVRGLHPNGLGLVGEMMAEGPDVRTALRNLVRLLPYNTLAGYPVFSQSGDVASLKFELRHPYFPGSEFILDGATGIAARLVKWLCGDGWQPLAVHLSRRRPADIGRFQQYFGAPVDFSATEDGVFFSSDWLDHTVPRERERREALRLEIGKAPLSELVRRQVALRLGFASLDAQEIARQIAMSRRQLYRSLKTEGTTCKALVDDFRFARARHLLAAGDAPLAEIALALGFPEHSSFTRAFVRWSGKAPGEWRGALHRSGAKELPAGA